MKRLGRSWGDKGICLVRTDEREGWYVHCWLNNGSDVFNSYVDDVDEALSTVLEKLESEED